MLSWPLRAKTIPKKVSLKGHRIDGMLPLPQLRSFSQRMQTIKRYFPLSNLSIPEFL
jgi:hypothetical protein